MSSDQAFSLTTLLGGAALFLYGMTLAKQSLQLVTGDRIRVWVHSLTDNRLLAVMVGVLLTTVTQSSTATAVMLVSFASAGLMTLVQGMGVLLGADIGTTITVQLLSLHLSDYALWLVIVGFLPLQFAKRKRYQYIGQMLLAFGLVFFGMGMMVRAMSSVRDHPLFASAVGHVTQTPLLGLVVAAALTAMVQSSAATIGITLSLAASGAIDLQDAIPWVLGANIGTCATAILASVGAQLEGRRVAWAHLMFKLTGVALVFPFLPQFTDFVRHIVAMLPERIDGGHAGVARQVAWAHTLFNVGISLVFFPIVPLGAALLRRLIRQNDQDGAVFRPKYLDPRALETPSLAFGNAMRELLRMADIAQEMVTRSLEVFDAATPPEVIEDLEDKDGLLDLLDREIKMYLTRLSRNELSEDQGRMELQLITLSSKLEQIGDVVDKNLLQLARKKRRLGIVFYEQAWHDLQEFHGQVCRGFQLAIAAYTGRDRDLAHKVIRDKRRLGEREDELREAHIAQLHKGLREAYQSSAVYLDVLSNLRRINSYAVAFAYEVVDHEPRREAADAKE